MIDYHIHTSRCCHATGVIDEYLAEAERKGLLEIGFADHFPLELLGCEPENRVTMHADELPAYLADVERMRKIACIPVRTGVEADYLPGREEVTAAALAAYPFDYIIGSIHFLDSWDFTHPRYLEHYRKTDLDLLYEQYFATVAKMAGSGLFDIAGHLDVVKKFAFFPQKDWSYLVEKTCRVLAANDLCVELNSSGWRAPVAEAYPSRTFLEKCRSLGVAVTLGSDAHCPGDVGRDLGRAVSLLKEAGFAEVAVFEGRKRMMRPLTI
ncbi:MAG: histidinol-phosphatase HisJ family protein [Dethiobacter sp.]|jgi:histidinol-phosphatase (PHP family)|nr:histidinol-phosphatase HisJ family protein [Dethiobacter sp.]